MLRGPFEELIAMLYVIQKIIAIIFNNKQIMLCCGTCNNVDLLGVKASFYFPNNNDSLCQRWIKFVCRKDWRKPSGSSVYVMIILFEPKYSKTTLNES